MQQIFVKKFTRKRKKCCDLKEHYSLLNLEWALLTSPERIDKMRYLFPDFEPLTPEKIQGRLP